MHQSSQSIQKKHPSLKKLAVFERNPDILLNFAAEIKQGGLVPPHSLIKITKFYAEKIVLSGVLAVDAFVNGHGANHDIEHGW